MVLLSTLASLLFVAPITLAFFTHKRGWNLIEQFYRLLGALPGLVREWTTGWNNSLEGGLRRARQRNNLKTSAQVFVAFASAVLGVLGLLAQMSNFTGTFAAIQQETDVFLLEMLSSVNFDPITLMGIEVGIACSYLGALLLDSMGITDIFYIFQNPENSEANSYSWVNSKRVFVLFVSLGGTVAVGYLLYESGILREELFHGASEENLLDTSGLSSESNDAQRASSASEQVRGEKRRSWAVRISSVLSALLGFIAGIFALANAIPVPALLIGMVQSLAATAARAARGGARVLTTLLGRIRALTLAVYNLVLSSRGEEPVDVEASETWCRRQSGKTDEGPQRSGSESGPGNNQSSSGQSSSGQTSSGQASSGQAAVVQSTTGEEPTASGPDSQDSGDSQTSDDEQASGDKQASDEEQDSGDEETSSSSPAGDEATERKPARIRGFVPWWFKNPPSKRPSNPDEAKKERGSIYETFQEAAEAIQDREPSFRACILKFGIEKDGSLNFLNRYEPPKDK